MGIIDEVKQKIDIVEIVGQYVQLTKSGRTMRAPCPFHSETKPSFFVYPEQQSWHCFGACNTGGDVFSFVMKKEGLDFGEALNMLAEKAGIQVPSQARSQVEDKARDIIYQINQSAAQYFNNLLLKNPAAEAAKKYLDKRGVNQKSIEDFQLGYALQSWDALKSYLTERSFSENDILSAGLLVQSEKTTGLHDRFRNKIMFPIIDDRGRISGFGSRVLDDSSPKYVNSPQTRVFDKSGSLYGIHLAKSMIRSQDVAVFVEGYMDVIIAHQFGFSNIISPMGVAITEKQINQIKKLTHNITLALDPDTAGEDAAMRCVAYENTLDTEVKVISLPDGKDPDEIILKDKNIWLDVLKKAEPVIEYTIKIITGKLDMKKSADKTEAINKILPILAEVKAGHRQYDYLTKLAIAANIDEKVLETSLIRYQFDKKTAVSKPAAIQKATRVIRANPVEEYALSLIIQHPELIIDDTLKLEYFESSENQAILELMKSNGGSRNMPDSLDMSLQEHYTQLKNKQLPSVKLENCLVDCVTNLRKNYLLRLQKKQTELLKYIAESGEKNADLQKLEEIGIEISQELNKLEKIKSKLRGVTVNEKR